MKRLIPIALSLSLIAAPSFAVNHSSSNPTNKTGGSYGTTDTSNTATGNTESGNATNRNNSTASSGTSMEPRASTTSPDERAPASETTQYGTATGGRNPSNDTDHSASMGTADQSAVTSTTTEKSTTEKYSSNKKKKRKKQ